MLVSENTRFLLTGKLKDVFQVTWLLQAFFGSTFNNKACICPVFSAFGDAVKK